MNENIVLDVIIKIIKKEVKLMDSDSNLKSSRKYHILKDFLKNNNETGTEDRITNSLKEILNSDGSFNKSKKRKLIELGFEIEEGKHYKLKYKGDDRYLLTLAKTPGDYKANINAVQEIIRQLFKS